MKKKDNTLTKEFFIREMRALDQKFDQMDHKFDHLSQTVHRMAVQVVKNTENIGELQAWTKSADVKFDSIMIRIDAFTKKYDVVDKKDTVHDYRLTQLEEKVAEHDRRLASLG